MKKILITGENSYIGTKFDEWVRKNFDNYVVETVSVKGNKWKTNDFSNYDVIYHVAGIAHIRETKKNKAQYFSVNRDLAYEVAKKAKREHVPQFIFLSTMSVYGIETGIIDKNTKVNPTNSYGKSKLEAEVLIKQLENESFRIAIIRPPMIYGKKCKGNYPKLSKIVRQIKIFPKIKNKRSMIFVDNFSEFTRLIIDNNDYGFFFPQNSDYVSTSTMVKLIAKENNKRIFLTRIFNPVLKIIDLGVTKKLFSDLVYTKDLSKLEYSYNVFDFEESIRLTEVGE